MSGATFALQLPDGRVAIVNCESKFAEHFAGPAGNHRSCRKPLVDNIQADFHGDKAKLEWIVSLDGKKKQTETYKVLAILAGALPDAFAQKGPNTPAVRADRSTAEARFSESTGQSPKAQPQDVKVSEQSTAAPSFATSAPSQPAIDIAAEGVSSITSEPDGAEIFIDSVGNGRTPALLRLKPGNHSVQVVYPGFKDWVSEVEVRAGSIVNVTATLQK